eukprot:gene48562-28300_t
MPPGTVYVYQQPVAQPVYIVQQPAVAVAEDEEDPVRGERKKDATKEAVGLMAGVAAVICCWGG